ncbi:MAG TPA: trypsin-like peptidase domain-containing protein [Lachnospiraceae bacterium]|nr:trypsin-like peptidase domain-containing protein [Lachnospiraceae bacterium]
MKKKGIFMRRLLSLLIVAVMVCATALTAFADNNTNQAVTQDTTGVVQLKVIYTDDAGNKNNIQEGTGFLINNSTVVTCFHVVNLSDDTMNTATQTFGKSAQEIKDRLTIDVSVLRDVTITAKIKNESSEMDYAILNLDSQLYDRTYLKVRSSATVQQTEPVYALGFPGEIEYFQDVNTYTSSDVTISNGQVSKNTRINNVDYVQCSAKFVGGNSGGPLVDGSGNVIGICEGTTGTGFDTDYYYAIAIDQLTQALDALGIEYTKSDSTGSAATSSAAAESTGTSSAAATSSTAQTASATTSAATSSTETTAAANKTQLSAAVTDAQKIEVKDYNEATGSKFSTALEKAQEVLSNENATQAEVDAAAKALSDAKVGLVKANSFPMWIVIAIAAVVALAVVIILLVVFAGRKKKAQPSPSGSYGGNGGYGSGSGFSPVSPITPSAPSQQPYMGGAATGETSVLNTGSEETTVLGNSVNAGTLRRSKTGEQISINTSDFTIGKEMSRVNYCITDNTSVSRIHARFVNHNGFTYITDLGSTNGTFVNGRKLTPNSETQLNDGDKVTIADEKFTYSAN